MFEVSSASRILIFLQYLRGTQIGNLKSQRHELIMLTMKSLFLHAIVLTSVAGFSVPAAAELYNCNGTWTNKPCEGQATKVLPETEKTVDLDSELLKKKKVLVGNLRERAGRAERDYDVHIDVTGIEETCRSESTTYEECMNLVNNADDRLNERINEAKLVKEQQKANRLQQENAEKKDDEKNNAVTVDEDSVVVLGDYDDYEDDFKVRRHRSHRDDRHGHGSGDHHKGEGEHGVDKPPQPPQEPPKRCKMGPGLQKDPLGRR